MSNISCYKRIQQTSAYCLQGCIFFSACLFFAHKAMAIDSISLSIEHFISPLAQQDSQKQTTSENHSQHLFKALQFEQLTLKLDIASKPNTITIDLSRLNLPEPYANLNELMITCHSLKIESSYIACTQGTIAIKGLIDELITAADFSLKYNPVSGFLVVSLDNLEIGKGRFSATFRIDKDQWQAKLDVKNMAYQTIKKYLKFYFKESLGSIEQSAMTISFLGQLSGELTTKSTAPASVSSKNKPLSIKSAALKGRIKNLSYEQNEDIAENINLDFNFKLESSSGLAHQVSMTLKKITGELFQNGIYLVFTGEELVKAKILFQASQQQVNLQRLFINLPGSLKLNSSGQINLIQDQVQYDLNTTFNVIDFTRFNDLYLKNILEGTDFEGLEIEGDLKANISNNNHTIDLNCQLSDLTLAYNDIAMVDLNGQIYWNNKEQLLSSMPVSQLSWREINLNNLPFGESQLKFKVQDDRLQLIQETDIPLFDGFLHINSLELTQIGQSADEFKQQSGMNIAIDGMIKPISLDLMSRHFDWPLLDGKLSAVIPYTTYNAHLLELGGALMMQVFDGVIIIKDLKIEQPLSDSARLFSNIDLNNINLQSLTKTFDFGEIEGRVEGKLAQLELDAWQPVAFDAYIRTPANDKSRHRISQRAIDNLSSLGGAPGILSRSFLSFFETFSYDKLGLSCKLKNNICEMNGIERSNKGNSYYIVKGGGIPRIDVMGFQHQVNWQVLTSRLKAIQSANQAVIE